MFSSTVQYTNDTALLFLLSLSRSAIISLEGRRHSYEEVEERINLPIAISGEEYTKPEKPRYHCNNCQFNLIRISDNEYFCNHCKSSVYPSSEEVRCKSRLSAPKERNTDALISYSPEPDDLTRKPVEPQGAFKALRVRGIKITSYKEE